MSAIAQKSIREHSAVEHNYLWRGAQTLTSTKGRNTLLSAIRYLIDAYDFRASEAVGFLCERLEQIDAEKKTHLVPVYRMHQPSMVSPCMLGSPCSVCAAHADCRTGRQCRDCRCGRVLCLRATPAEPAFHLTFTRAMAFVRHGLATFINRNQALRLTFSKIAQLRDHSLKIDESVLIAYADDSLFLSSAGERGKRDRRTRVAIDYGWRFREPVVEIPASVMAASKERVQCFT